MCICLESLDTYLAQQILQWAPAMCTGWSSQGWKEMFYLLDEIIADLVADQSTLRHRLAKNLKNAGLDTLTWHKTANFKFSKHKLIEQKNISDLKNARRYSQQAELHQPQHIRNRFCLLIWAYSFRSLLPADTTIADSAPPILLPAAAPSLTSSPFPTPLYMNDSLHVDFFESKRNICIYTANQESWASLSLKGPKYKTD